MSLSVLFTPLNITLIIFACVICFFIRGKPRADLVAVCGLLALTLTGVVTMEEALSGFSNSVTLMIVGVFIVGTAIFRTGLAKMVGSRLLRLAGDSENKLFILVMLATAFMGAFVSNTGVVAMMLPIIISITAGANTNPRMYLMPLAFASAMGFFTLISTTSNLVIQNKVIENGFAPFGFFSFAPLGFICLGIGMVMLFFMSKMLVKDDETKGRKKTTYSLTELVKKYQLKNELFSVSVPDNSPAIDKTIAELNVSSTYGVSINQISRKPAVLFFSKNRQELIAGPDTKLLKGDILSCRGNVENVTKFAQDNKLDIIQEYGDTFSEFNEFGIAEVYIMPTSKLVHHSVSNIKFRELYNVNILGIQRQGKYIMDNISSIKLKEGDALLVHGAWNDLANLGEEHTDLLLVGQPLKEAAKVTLDYKAPVAAIIMVLMIISMVFNIVSPVISILTATVLMVLTGCIRNMEEAYNGINWQSVVLIAAMIPTAIAFEKTGVTRILSESLVSFFGGNSNHAVLAGIYICASIVTMFISNTATTIMLAPIAMQTALSIGASPYPFLMAVATGSTMCFASPFSTPPNAIVMTAGRYSFTEFIKVGLPVQVVIGVVMILALPLIFPF
ncbi:MAG: SLC13 family permease [Deferribacteraceae bacterium]|jgi:di/tricarboxylate transporter|nr:SLC13 family permease [Deferribacteraceae bacterium]